jgi:hypothetical protein
MPRFVVWFMKDVLGENGHETEICQCSLEIDASSEVQATELAKRKFCETERLRVASCRQNPGQRSRFSVLNIFLHAIALGCAMCPALDQGSFSPAA